jgi:adenylate cyclase
MVHFTKQAPARTIPAWQIFEPNFDRSLVEGTIVLVGTSAVGLKDLRPTPLNPFEAGVNVHASALEQIIAGDYLQRPDWSDGAELLSIILFGALLLALLRYIGVIWAAVAGTAFVAAAVGASWFAYTEYRFLLDPVYLGLSMFVIYSVQSLLQFLKTERERREVRSAFGRYLSPVLVERLARHPEELRLGGELRTLTCLFSDIQGFTSISEKLTPEELISLLNGFLTPMTDVILKSGGTIDKYMGDAIMAFWNAPLDDGDHAKRACLAALEMQTRLAEFNANEEREAKSQGRTFIPVNIGIGVNTGACSVGNMGSDQRFDYSALGDAINIASRLEGQTRNYGVPIIVGEETQQAISDLATLELDAVRVKGKNLPLLIYALLGDRVWSEGEEFKNMLSLQHEMLTAYRQTNWSGAMACLDELRQVDNGSMARYAQLMISRIKEYKRNPPGEDWDGVYTATSK